MIKLQLLLGSNSYGLATETSDTDVYIIGSGPYMMPQGRKPHVIQDSKELYVAKSLLEYKKHPLYLQTLFPAEFLVDTDASRYVIESRESVIDAQANAVYEIYTSVGTQLLDFSEYLYLSQPKRIAYGVMFLDTIYRYAQGESFASAFRPEYDFRQWLLNVRAKRVPLNEILAVSNEKKALAQSVAGFYDRRPNLKLLNDWREEMLLLLSE